MATTQEYIEQLKIDKQTLVDNLVEQGVEATSEETFTTLVPKVKDIKVGQTEEKDVSFYDYDGTRLYSYTIEEIQNMEKLPELPTHDGLICQEWNWTLEELKEHNKKMHVGATYITDDGATRVYISLTDEERLEPTIGFTLNGTIEIDWGDNSEFDVVTGNSISMINTIYRQHTYNEIGDYVIRLIPQTEETELKFSGHNDYGSYLLCVQNSLNRNYQTCIKKVEFGAGVKELGMAFKFCYLLETVTIPKDVYIQSEAFHYCYELKAVVMPKSTLESLLNLQFGECRNLKVLSLPPTIVQISNANPLKYTFHLRKVFFKELLLNINEAFSYSGIEKIELEDGMTSLPRSSFSYCYFLKKVKLPNTLTLIPQSCFNYCYNLITVNIPNGVQSIESYAFNNCYSLKKIDIPASVTSIGASAFSACYSLEYISFANHTSVPTLASTNAFTSSATHKIIVPDELYDEWITTTNWSNTNIVSKIVKASEYPIE